jgi:DNA-binding response OmpR family regulator
MKKNLLLVEDDMDLGNVLTQYLKLQHFEVGLARTGEQGLDLFKKKDFDLCILDIMLPGIDGFAVAEKVRNLKPSMPVIFLTARTSKDDIVKGLKLGADDYICKPFEPEELVLRIQNILKRTGKTDQDMIVLGKFLFYPGKLQLTGYEKSYRLTQKEAELLNLLVVNNGVILKREDILVELWGEDDYFLGRSLDVFISRLRKYLKPEDSIGIETIRGVGYMYKSSK